MMKKWLQLTLEARNLTRPLAREIEAVTFASGGGTLVRNAETLAHAVEILLPIEYQQKDVSAFRWRLRSAVAQNVRVTRITPPDNASSFARARVARHAFLKVGARPDTSPFMYIVEANMPGVSADQARLFNHMATGQGGMRFRSAEVARVGLPVQSNEHAAAGSIGQRGQPGRNYYAFVDSRVADGFVNSCKSVQEAGAAQPLFKQFVWR